MRLSRCLGLVLVLWALVMTTSGCTAILGDFTSEQAAEGDGGNDATFPGTEGGVTPDSSLPDTTPASETGANETGADTFIQCPSGQKDCGGVCVSGDVSNGCSDPTTCNACSFANAVPASVCVSGACALDHCLNGYADCNGIASDGCEVHTANDPNHCGTCATKCTAANGTGICAGGTCSGINCNPGYADCDHNPANGCEVNIGADPNNCGTCGYVCGTTNGTPSCGTPGAGDGGAPDAGEVDGGSGSAAQCIFACNAGWAHCPSSADKSGCDVDTNTDNNNCGACGHQCALGTTCSGGSCSCNATTCPNGCCDSTGACVTSTPSGPCGKAGSSCVTCPSGQECNVTAGKCVCDATSCPKGCCDSTGACQTAEGPTACGTGGAACSNCQANGAECVGSACKCDATSCPNGCCNGNTCVPVGASQNTNQCGNGGNSCGTCAGGQACSNGACSCGGASCSTCCANGVCAPASNNNTCGANGAACVTCPANQECNSQGKCVCDANTCKNGCCDTNGVCQTSEGPNTCGLGGASCGTCVNGQICDGVTGACVCNASSCPKGCCNGNTCVPYLSQGLGECGTAGAQCGPCAQGQTCSATGACVCTATSCKGGCCDKNGLCQNPSPNTCGTAGGSCTTCANGQDCVGGACVCDAATCGHGCCSNNQCITTELAGACGTGGGSCSTCVNGQHCNGSACVCDSTSCTGSYGGCCSGNSCVFYASENINTCGANGASCGPCTNPGQECSTSSHTCTCDSTSCPKGCCNGNTCVPWASEGDGECGTAGAQCNPCPSGQGCNKSNGVCGCSGASCSGCCDTHGVCQTSGPTTCGTLGAGCQDCQALGEECLSGTCKCDTNTCSGGCCGSTGCVTYANQASQGVCGTGANACTACAPGLHCNGSGVCVCDASSCNGCCSSPTTCEAFGSQSQGSCGANGATCGPCASTQACISGVCTCNSTYCSGCCTAAANGTCLGVAAQSNPQCGTGGALCTSCPNGKGCDNGACTCDAKTCPSGCCDANGICQAPVDSTCGTGGAACTNCLAKGQACSAGVCASITTSGWDSTWSLAGVTFSNGNLSIAQTATTVNEVRALDGRTAGKWYWEVTATGGDGTTDSGGIGIANSSFPNNAGYLGSADGSIGYGYGSCCSSQYYFVWTGASLATPGATLAIKSGNIYMFALDMDAGHFWTGANGIWFNGGNPSAAAAPVVTGLSGTVYPGVTFYASSINAFTANFGASAFAYPVPTGFYPGFGAPKYGVPSLACVTGSVHNPYNTPYIVASKIFVPVTTTIVAMGITTISTGYNGIAALYDASGSGGTPGKLVASSAAFAVQNGINQVPITPTVVPAGTYWIGAEFSAAAAVCLDSGTANTVYYFNYGTFGAPPPANFTSPGSIGSFPNVAFYVVAQ